MDAAQASSGTESGGATASPSPERESRAAVILGNDAVIAARPHSPFQLANACKAAGFDLVVPPSWGDELVADTFLEHLPVRHEAAVVACACARVRRLLPAAGADALLPQIVIAAPPIAAARYLRLTYGNSILVTYVGDCPSADDPSINARFSPAGFLASLERQGISIASQSESISDSDAGRWQRYRSLPGGIPARRWLARAPIDRVLREVDPTAIEQYRSATGTRSNVLLDLTEGAACACGSNRAVIEEYESSRSSTPILVAPPGLNLADTPAHEPGVPRRRTPATVVAVEATPPREPTAPSAPAEPQETSVAASAEPVVDSAPVETPAAPPPATVAPPQVQGPLVAPRSSGPRLQKAEARRLAQAAADRRRRVVALVVIPTAVLAVVAALGIGAYAFASRGRAESTAAAGESTTPSVPDTQVAVTPDTTPATTSPTIDSVSVAGSVSAPDSTAPVAVTDTTKRRDSTAIDSTAMSDSARAAARRARARGYEIVPGWLPQGKNAWKPADSTQLKRPDSAAVRPKPDTIPPA